MGMEILWGNFIKTMIQGFLGDFMFRYFKSIVAKWVKNLTTL